ncbi:MAG: hypothetical protein GYB67_12180 [Chloroflexi bacterium]|nr:hypothetical protein [Chloroflexota bacterium]
MSRDRILQIVVVILAITQVISAFTIGGTINSASTGVETGVEVIADQYPNQFVPEDYVFAIWGPIYAGLLAFAYYQARPSRAADPALRAVRVPMAVAFFGNTIWIPFSIADDQIATGIIIAVMLAALATAYAQLQRLPVALTRREWWWIVAPISLFFGWITIATVANFTLTLIYVGWDGLGIAAATWSSILLVVATVIVSAMTIYGRGNIIYGSVAIWAFVGIALRYADPVQTVATLMTLVVLAVIVLSNVQQYLANRNRDRSLPAERAAA